MMAAAQEQVVSKLDPTKPKHHRILRFLALGLTPPEIADHIQCSVPVVRKIANDPATPEAIERVRRLGNCMNEILYSEFDNLQKESVRVLGEIIESNDPKVTPDHKLRAAQAILDRHPEGHFIKTGRNINTEQTTIGLDNETLNALKRIASRTNAEVIDVGPSSQPEPVSHPGSPQQQKPGGAPIAPPAGAPEHDDGK